MARRTKEDAAQTREAVLKAALDLFYEKGYTRTTFDEIAKRINLTKGAVYWHFRNKADLLAELLKDRFQARRAQLNLPEPRTLNELREGFRREAEATEQDPEFCKFLFFIVYQMEWSEAMCQKIGEQVREIRDYPMKRLKETLTILQKSGEITAEINIDDLASVLFSFWRGTIVTYLSRVYPFVLSRQVVQGFDLILDGVKVEKI